MGQWGVKLVNSSVVNTQWVVDTAQQFIDGYIAGHDTSQPTSIIIGTSNANYNWECENSTSAVSGKWYDGGISWGQILGDLYSSRSDVVILSGNDFESWTGEAEFGDWEACGLGAVAWMDGFKNESSRINVNFGSHAYAENTLQWTENQLVAISGGLTQTELAPQIYCSGNPGQWTNIALEYNEIRFRSVISSNAFGVIPNCFGDSQNYPYSAADSWYKLYDALSVVGEQHRLEYSVSSFWFDDDFGT